MVNPLELTYYLRTGYNPSDEPADDAVIEQNEHWTSPMLLKEYDPEKLSTIKVRLTDEQLKPIDYLKIRDTITGKRYYYYVVNHARLNESVAAIHIALDPFATVGLSNISFFGNVTRRSLSDAEKENYSLLPEPWAPRRPLKTRRVVIDLNVNKTVTIPSHISTIFTEDVTDIENTQTIEVPNSPLGLSIFEDSLSIDTVVPYGHPNAAADTTDTLSTPWGSLQYVTPYEQYYHLTGGELVTFLEKAKKYNALDLIEPAYYLPSPDSSAEVQITELSNPGTRNLKASKYYTTITIRSLASNSAKTYSDQDTDLQVEQSLTVVVAPDKNGGIYVLPSTIRDTGLSAYTYLDGVYSPFETVVHNAIGDTPGKFAADGTTILNTALNNLFQTYINKVNAMQVEGMQAKYFKDVGTVKGVVMSFVSDLLASESTTTTTTEGFWQNTDSTTKVPELKQRSEQTQNMPQYKQSVDQTTTINGHSITNSINERIGNRTITTRANSSTSSSKVDPG